MSKIHTILVVDDEENVIRSLARLLRAQQYNVLVALSGLAGLQLLYKHKVDLVISDIKMPQMDGIQFLRKVKAQYPETIRIVLTGHADTEKAVDAINEGEVYRFLQKPWNNDELIQVIRQSLEHYDLLRDVRLLLKAFNTRRQVFSYLKQQNEKIVQQIIKDGMAKGFDLPKVEKNLDETVDKIIDKYYPGMNIHWVGDEEES